MTKQAVAGRYLIVLFFASIIVSSATIYDYSSNWFHGAALIGSIQRNVLLRWNYLSIEVPGNPNGTVRMVSELRLNNSAEANIILVSIVQRYYLLGYLAADEVAVYTGGGTLHIPQGGDGVIRTVVGVLYATKSGLYFAANSTGNWNWITHVSVTVGSGDLSVLLCFMGSIQNRPNATGVGPVLYPASCSIPTPMRSGGGGR